jgi:beta-glucosidase-like glycosyl hydrolase
LCIAAILLGIGRYYVLPTYFPHLLKGPNSEKQQTVEATPVATSSAETSTPIASISAQLLNTLTPRQKVAQLIAVPVVISSNTKESVPATAAATTSEVPGFVTIFGQNISALQVDQLTSQLRRLPQQPQFFETLAAVPSEDRKLLRPLVAVDHEGGTVQRLTGQGMTVLPSAAEQCKLTGDELNAVLSRTAKELSGVGIDIVFAPVMDLGKGHSVLKSRLCSDDPTKVLEYGERWILAMEANHIMPVLKHYPGIGQTTVDLHQRAESIDFNPREHALFVSLLTKYRKAGVMTTHVSLKRQNDQTAIPCTFDPGCLDLLDVQGQHLVFSDSLEMGAAQVTPTKQSLTELAIQAVDAGHLVIVLGRSVTPKQVDELITGMADFYQRDPGFREEVDFALTAIWQSKYDHWQNMTTN